MCGNDFTQYVNVNLVVLLSIMHSCRFLMNVSTSLKLLLILGITVHPLPVPWDFIIAKKIIDKYGILQSFDWEDFSNDETFICKVVCIIRNIRKSLTICQIHQSLVVKSMYILSA